MEEQRPLTFKKGHNINAETTSIPTPLLNRATWGFISPLLLHINTSKCCEKLKQTDSTTTTIFVKDSSVIRSVVDRRPVQYGSGSSNCYMHVPAA